MTHLVSFSLKSPITIRNKTHGINVLIMQSEVKHYFLTALLRIFPALNLGTFTAGIFISFSVCGFRPFLAFLLETENVPKPTRLTASNFFKDLVTAVVKAFRSEERR